MGVTLGNNLQANGHQVLWVSTGRSEASRIRAAAFAPLSSVEELCERADLIISVCPPDKAQTLATQVAAAAYKGHYLDANALAPQTSAAIASLFGDKYTDGGIIGPPAVKPGTTRLYLSGPNADLLVPLFAQGALEACAIGTDPTAASALKMCYAAYSKGISALVLAIRAMAQAYSVTPDLVAEWDLSQPGLSQRSEQMALGTAPKAWRFAGEMREIAATFEQVGLPGDFHLAAAQIYSAMADLKDQDNAGLEQVIQSLLTAPN